MSAIGSGPIRATPPGDLQRLLETERRLGERLQAARAERDRWIADAEAAAATAERTLAEEIAQDERLLEERVEQEAARGEQEIAARAYTAVAAWGGIPDDRIVVIARELAQRFIAEQSI